MLLSDKSKVEMCIGKGVFLFLRLKQSQSYSIGVILIKKVNGLKNGTLSLEKFYCVYFEVTPLPKNLKTLHFM